MVEFTTIKLAPCKATTVPRTRAPTRHTVPDEATTVPLDALVMVTLQIGPGVIITVA
jgi:hypothetical protein